MPTELGSVSICPDCGVQVLGGLYGSGHSCQASLNRLKKELERTRGILFYSRDETYGWLSNFHRARVLFRGKEYPTSEHAYQAAKANEQDVAEWIRQAPKPFCAMKAGRSLRPHEMTLNWDTVKFQIMREVLLAKFGQNPDLKEKLLATGNTPLHENSPTDMIWGVKGKDMLGKILMEVRQELRAVH